jgi:hypothetical protein
MTPEEEKEFINLVRCGRLKSRAVFKITRKNLNLLRSEDEVLCIGPRVRPT